MADTQKRIEELRAAVHKAPASEDSIELARLLIDQEDGRAEAREVLFRAIAVDPKLALARLLLSRAFYLDDMIEFSVRELVELRKHTDAPSLDKLLAAFGAYAKPFMEDTPPKPVETRSKEDESSAEEDDDEDVLAEIDIDDEFLDALDELED